MGGGVTVTVAVPLTDPLEAVIIVAPAFFAVNMPVVGSIVPTVVLLLDHVIVATIVLLNWSRAVAVNDWVPPTVKDTVAGETVIVVNSVEGGETVTVAVPLTDPLDAFMVVVPADFAVNIPAESIIPTEVLLLDHVIVASIELLNWSSVVATNV